MAEGRADFVPIRPWDLATETFLQSAIHIRALLVVAAIPELVRVAMLVVYGAVMRTTGAVSWIPPQWSLSVLSDAISAVVFVGIIRYVACAEGPSWLPVRAWLRNYLLTAAVLIALWLAIALVTDNVFSGIFLGGLLPLDPLDEVHGFWLGKAYDWTLFAVSALLIAMFYPILGMTGVRGELDIHRLLRWWRKYLPRFVVLAVVLMSVCLLLQRAYWWLLDIVLPGLATDISYIGRETLRSLMMQMTQVPMDILFDIVPAVAIGMIFKILRANSAGL